MPRNYNSSTSAYVTLEVDGQPYKYGFKCRAQAAATYTDLGITKVLPTDINPTLLQGMILGANSPKPPRASKLSDNVAHGYESSFVSTAKVAEARGKGWKITPGKASRGAFATARSQTAYVTINGVKYAWQMPKLPSASEGQVNLADIGVAIATNATDGLVFGASFPKPPRAGKFINDAEDAAPDRFTTFYDPSIATLPNTWAKVASRTSNRHDLDALKAMI